MDLKLFLLGSLAISAPAYAQDAPIAHDSEFYILQAQNKDAWEQDDTAVDQALAAFRDENGGNPPNIISILVDDIGFGDMGIPELNAVRGISTPNINDFSDEAMRMVRMYTEPSCTPTRVAQTTGRLPVRIGMGDTTVDIAGFGLPGEEVTLAEVLKAEGYATSHVGKWHMGDIAESWAMNQGFDYAQHAVHQQGQLTIFNDDAIREQVSVGIADFVDDYTIDDWFRPDASAMATVIEGNAGGPVREIRMEPGERWNAAKYDEMNQAFQDKTLSELERLAGGTEPFFLQYWPMIPLDNTRAGRDGPESVNGGLYADKLQELDTYLGEIFTRMDELGVTDKTIVVLMGDNGHFTKYSPASGFTPMVFRGGKGDTTEGGVRVDAFIRWPGLIEPDSMINNIIHVSDLYTTLARFGGAVQHIPRDRLIDGVDQSASILFQDESKGRRDHVIIYSVSTPKAVVKDKLKLNLPGPGQNAIIADFFDVMRDTHEKYPVSTEVGAWGGQEFVRILGRHMARKELFPDTGPATGMPYEGIENLRPETQQAVEAFMVKRSSAQQ
ncbi:MULTISPECIES: sulfatase-like hydrolase/transferase [unclassified Ruegeria]|uniref:sulfatase-like hydrolase/transferase n=1 Tax=unclassified Ruegeria TaxID=2625375 RepID=UPI001492DABE|nr:MULTISPECIES: sulfatase-like hydrolase/transferase [unclassified Ruegeria]NOD85217.1 sulfatase-like hydrolase/transferase [Ruegeria sp. HKCCD6119]